MSFVDIPVSHGRLEGLLWKEPNARAAALVCHPHPLHGGTMHNHVTYRIAQAFRNAGISTLRFNFRGVGRTTGTHDGGRGELDDAAVALGHLAQVEPGVPLLAAGFSFGSRVALQLALRDARVERALGVGLAVDLFDFSFLAGLDKPKAFVQPDKDEYGTLPRVEALVASLPPPAKLFVVPDCTHLAPGRLDAVSTQLDAAIAWLLGA